MKREFRIIVETKENDFCFSDLKEAIIDGLNNVGNYTFKKVYEVEE